MPNDRLSLALDQIPSADWQFFERFAAEFLAVEYPSLRTMAAQRGDGGRDGILYQPTEDANIVIQYSLSSDWNAKINATLRRLSETFPETEELIYVTNRTIGPDADDLIRKTRKGRRIFLDIRDKNWFLERELSHPQRETASQEIIQRIVEPLLVERRLRTSVAPALTNEEARVGLLHLALDERDQKDSKSYTKTCFESLVMAALHDSDLDNLLSGEEVNRRILAYLPASHQLQASQQADSALRRLSRKGGPVHFHSKEKKYCLSHPERQKLQAKVSEYLLFEAELEAHLLNTLPPELLEGVSPEKQKTIGIQLRAALETVLLRRGEAFVEATKSGHPHQIDVDEIDVALDETDKKTGNVLNKKQIASAVVEILDRPTGIVRKYLNRVADAYTMFAFLRQTPDVQKSLLKMFSSGEIWLDASAILPLVAETLVEDPADRRYSALMRAIKDAGLRLYVTDGVIEEVERHLNKCIAFSRTGHHKWRNDVPFIQRMYILSGRSSAQFISWVEQFRGDRHPEDDVKLYLNENFGIESRNLTELVDDAPADLRQAVQEIWFESHEKRRSGKQSDEWDFLNVHRLVSHDVENTVGVIQCRKNATVSPLGYHHWWLTLDRVAFSLQTELRRRLGRKAPDSPAISPDFLSQYLRLGPLRAAIDKELWISLPILTDISRFDFLPKNLVSLADQIRLENANLNEGVLRRRVRDQLEDAKMIQAGNNGASAKEIYDELGRRIRDQANGPSE